LSGSRQLLNVRSGDTHKTLDLGDAGLKLSGHRNGRCANSNGRERHPLCHRRAKACHARAEPVGGRSQTAHLSRGTLDSRIHLRHTPEEPGGVGGNDCCYAGYFHYLLLLAFRSASSRIFASYE